MRKTKILITEDEYIVSKNLENKLSQLGYEVIGVASSGEDAIEIIKLKQPDLVLMDIMLAGKMDGIETANIIKKEYDIPLIFLTAYSSQEIYSRAEISEPYAYIIKPFEERELEINISIALYKHKAEQKLKIEQERLEILNKNLDKLVKERTEELSLKNQELQEEVIIRRKAEENKRRLARVIEQAEDHIIITNVKGVIEYVNPSMLNFLGYSEKEVYGMTPKILKPLNKPKFIYKQMWQTIMGGDTYSGDFINIKKSGELYYSQTVIVPFKNSKNEVTHFASIGRDITEKMNEEREKISLIEKEKERISKELHDGIGQTLTAIKLSVGSLVKSAIPEQEKTLESVKQLIDQSTQEVREVSFNLMPSVLSDYGLEAAIKKLVGQVSQNNTFKIKLNYHSRLKRLDKDIEIGIYRIIQEALNNAQKYANCSQINIAVKIIDKNIFLSVIDNGVGHDFLGKEENDLPGGQGIHNMANRAKLIDGSFSINSIINKGTSIEVIIPINYE